MLSALCGDKSLTMLLVRLVSMRLHGRNKDEKQPLIVFALSRYHVLMDRCYASISPYPTNSTFFNLFVSWGARPFQKNLSALSLTARVILISLSLSLAHVVGALGTRWQSCTRTATATTHASLSLPFGSLNRRTRQSPPTTCTASPDSARLANAATLRSAKVQECDAQPIYLLNMPPSSFFCGW